MKSGSSIPCIQTLHQLTNPIMYHLGTLSNRRKSPIVFRDRKSNLHDVSLKLSDLGITEIQSPGVQNFAHLKGKTRDIVAQIFTEVETALYLGIIIQ